MLWPPDLSRGCSTRPRAQGHRLIIHRWPAARMHGVRTLASYFVENVTSHNVLLKRLMRKGRA